MRPLLIIMVAVLIAMSSVNASAGEDHPTFVFPVDCKIGTSCWIPNYVDMKPGKGVLDYACGDATYDAQPHDQHKGTDIAVLDMAAVRYGIPVFAAAAGDVLSQRDGIPDNDLNERTDKVVSSMACGNGVRIQHDNGYISQYCHMKKGSVFVMPGERLKRGQFIGQVGLSGWTEFPHLHFQVTKDGQVVDPFAGVDRQNRCGVGKHTLWDQKTLAAIPYEPTAIYNMGFASAKPDFKAIRSGLYKAKTFSTEVPALVVWADIFRVKKNDRLVLQIKNPRGQIIHDKVVPITRTQVRYARFSGLRLKQAKWPVGTYQATVSLKRGTKTFVAKRTINIH